MVIIDKLEGSGSTFTPLSINKLDGEMWLPAKTNRLGKILDFPGYLVSTKGRVYSIRSMILLSLNNKVGSGYIAVNLRSPEIGKSSTYMVHRLVAATFLGNENLKSHVNHKDGDRVNNCLENLEWVSCRENLIHGHDRRYYVANRTAAMVFNKQPEVINSLQFAKDELIRIASCDESEVSSCYLTLNIGRKSHIIRI